MKTKIFIIPVLLVLLISSYFVLNSYSTLKSEPMPSPYFNVRVFQYGGTIPQNNAEVVYKQGGSTVYTSTTDNTGWVYTALASGTYDVYVYYPARPNDQQSGSLLNHYHDGDENVSISLGPVY